MDAQQIISDIETRSRGQASVADVCADMGINRSTWQRIKAGKFKPSHETLLKLLRKLEELHGVAA